MRMTEDSVSCTDEIIIMTVIYTITTATITMITATTVIRAMPSLASHPVMVR